MSVKGIILLGSLANLVLAVSKFFAGWCLDSNALVADGWHSITDLAVDAVTATTVMLSSFFDGEDKKAARRVEGLGSLLISIILCIGGAKTARNSWLAFHEQGSTQGGHSLDARVAWIPLLTIAVKEGIYLVTSNAAKARHSSILASSAAHHRADSWVSLTVLVAFISARIFHASSWVDSLGGIVLSAMVLREGSTNAMISLRNMP